MVGWYPSNISDNTIKFKQSWSSRSTLLRFYCIIEECLGFNNIWILYNIIMYCTSDIYYQTADQSISVIESITTTNSPSLSCSSSGSTTITYTCVF